ncbi:hypothetical protein [Pseudomonas arsenicoxydans]|uniref:Uncharacterized protein n=1 Tax=Pseudomonas arsenicoxydans TaxID=702115 RepID=A0A502HPD4_9PSED|nr:hypothetical protein [Pseudomonas arsenicoxydans]TPG75655.1 hypothetical protein EAH78_19030 [Pseudomonas arsenicoxydans]
MITTLLNDALSPDELITTLKTLNTSADIHNLVSLLHNQSDQLHDTSKGAAIMKSTNTHTGTLTLYCNKNGNISLKVPDRASPSPLLYTVPGKSVLFAINDQSFPVQLFGVEASHLIIGQQVIVDANNPLFIDGTKVLFDSNPTGDGHVAFIGSINLPDRSADIGVFDRATRCKVAWFPHDDSAARYLVSLELLEAAQDPGAVKVAEELIYHYHPAVAWKAFQVIQQTNPQTALNFVPLLRNLQNSRLNYLLDQQSEVA